MIVVTGPTGNTGRQVVEGLRQRNLAFRAMVRSEERAQQLTAEGIPTVLADFTRPETLVRALTGATTAFLVCTPDARLARCEQNFIRAAQQAGVSYIVKCGAHSAAHDSKSPNLRMHAEVEDALRESGLRYAIIRPHGFMQTFFWMSAPLIYGPGILSFPAGDGAIPLIDVRDVGAALLKALLEPGLSGRAYDLTGPQALTPQQMAAELSRALGRPIQYVESRLEDLDATMRQLGVPDAPREHVLWVFAEQRAGRLNYTSRDHEALGLPLRSFAEFAADMVAGRTGVALSDFSH